METLIIKDEVGRIFIAKRERSNISFNGSEYSEVYFLYDYSTHEFITRVDNGEVKEEKGFLFFSGVLPSPLLQFKLEVLTCWDGDPFPS